MYKNRKTKQKMEKKKNRNKNLRTYTHTNGKVYKLLIDAKRIKVFYNKEHIGWINHSPSNPPSKYNFRRGIEAILFNPKKLDFDTDNKELVAEKLQTIESINDLTEGDLHCDNPYEKMWSYINDLYITKKKPSRPNSWPNIKSLDEAYDLVERWKEYEEEKKQWNLSFNDISDHNDHVNVLRKAFIYDVTGLDKLEKRIADKIFNKVWNDDFSSVNELIEEIDDLVALLF